MKQWPSGEAHWFLLGLVNDKDFNLLRGLVVNVLIFVARRSWRQRMDPRLASLTARAWRPDANRPTALTLRIKQKTLRRVKVIIGCDWPLEHIDSSLDSLGEARTALALVGEDSLLGHRLGDTFWGKRGHVWLELAHFIGLFGQQQILFWISSI